MKIGFSSRDFLPFEGRRVDPPRGRFKFGFNTVQTMGFWLEQSRPVV